MIQQTRIMLYVGDVNLIAKFWITQFGAQIVERNPLPDNFANIVLQITEDVQFSLFNREFIRQHSPEVLGPVPSIMLFIDNFADMAAKLNPHGKVMEMNGGKTLNFNDPEGNYFVIAEKN